ncbi:hypothetical protein ACQ33O_10245 [Ferruginibacter sp. SUN002]|uniref:tetratricopeptide repeat protein n=1 Tax=Ferruginibacter sp. SUN002 TaxID=2937789 RepID=UPI003D367582
MKHLHLLTVIFLFTACQHRPIHIVSEKYVDSLLQQTVIPVAYKQNAEEIKFWQQKIDPKNPGMVAELKYASSLATRFNLTGDINDIKRSDSILHTINRTFKDKEAAPYLGLIRHAILQHKFLLADSFLQQAQRIGIKPYESSTTSFDVDFELGRFYEAEQELKKITSNDYGYFFRFSKLAHYRSDVDTAISSMQKALETAGTNLFLKQAALSNLADLYLHNGQLEKAYAYYKESIQLSSADLHSIMGIAWIALVHDKNTFLAEKLLAHVQIKTKSPEPIYKLMYVAQAKGDSIKEMQYAKEFVLKVSDSVYGNMYNKYLIEIFTGVLNEPAKAEAIAKNELLNRSTSQTYAWYVWALFKNNRYSEAYNVFQNHVSGKPLEGLELYWMGKVMKGLNKGYNAEQFFKEANKNKYDLSPVIIQDLEKNLDH